MFSENHIFEILYELNPNKKNIYLSLLIRLNNQNKEIHGEKMRK